MNTWLACLSCPQRCREDARDRNESKPLLEARLSVQGEDDINSMRLASYLRENPPGPGLERLPRARKAGQHSWQGARGGVKATALSPCPQRPRVSKLNVCALTSRYGGISPHQAQSSVAVRLDLGVGPEVRPVVGAPGGDAAGLLADRLQVGGRGALLQAGSSLPPKAAGQSAARGSRHDHRRGDAGRACPRDPAAAAGGRFDAADALAGPALGDERLARLGLGGGARGEHVRVARAVRLGHAHRGSLGPVRGPACTERQNR